MLALQSSIASEASIVGVVAASLVLVLIAIGLARWLGLGVDRDLIVACLRAAVQLLAVGLLLTAVFRTDQAYVWAVVWVVAMVVIAATVVVRRTPREVGRLWIIGFGVVSGSTLLSLAVVFGFGVIDLNPISLVVIAGITIGNSMPSTVLGVNQAVSMARDRIGEIEASLALGFDRGGVARQLAPRAARAALIPQIERTKVVGLIALPGAMTGLLLAGVSPVDAVIIQLVIMYLILGAAAVCVVAAVAVVCRSAVDPSMRTSSWVRSPNE